MAPVEEGVTGISGLYPARRGAGARDGAAVDRACRSLVTLTR
jgi:hypothetical protein